MAPFTMAAAHAAARDRCRLRRARPPARARRSCSRRSGAYVGGDIVAGLLATGLTLDRRIRLFIDVGTNSEIALGSSARALATAAPAGPGLRGRADPLRHARRGRRDRGREDLRRRGRADRDRRRRRRSGMCGSGLVDAVAELVGAGLLDRSGRFVLGRLASASAKIGEENVFHLTDDVYLSQRDVRELQFAKASIATGWNLLCRELGIAPEEIAQVLLAGSFGSYLSAASAVRIGLVPEAAARRASSRPATSPARARRSSRSRCRSARPRRRSSTRSSTSSSPAAPTSTTSSSTSSRSRRDDRRSSPAGRSRSTCADRGPPRLGRRGPRAAAGAAQPARADRPRRRHGAALARLRHGCGSRTPTAAPTARSTGCGGASGSRATTATTSSRTTRCARRWPRSPARTS